jgi:pyrimidine-nucleoside phosphorylase
VRAVELIERKRDGGEHPPGEVTWLVEGFVAGRVAPEQMSAWSMAVVWRGLSDAETHELTQAMIDSGATIDLSSLGRTVVDKHSTGGVGDKTTIALAPLAAAMGMPVAKLSGRGLAHTGGTLDKLE